jgi:hypothetical protein
MAHENHAKLPPLVVGPVDVGRLTREIESINDAMMQLKLRQNGETAKNAKLPETSGLMDQVVEYNKLNLLHEADRNILLGFLKHIKAKAPIMHVSFSADPSAAFLEKIMVWLRREIHPYTLMTVGLQPNIGAGCVLRTTNKYFDLSLRQSFAEKRGLLIDKLNPAGLDDKPKADINLPQVPLTTLDEPNVTLTKTEQQVGTT